MTEMTSLLDWLDADPDEWLPEEIKVRVVRPEGDSDEYKFEFTCWWAPPGTEEKTRSGIAFALPKAEVLSRSHELGGQCFKALFKHLVMKLVRHKRGKVG